MGNGLPLSFGISILIALNLAAQEPEFTITGPRVPVAPNAPTTFRLNALNTSTQEVIWSFPRTLQCQWTSDSGTSEKSAALLPYAPNDSVRLAPGMFVQREYEIVTPPVPGPAALSIPDFSQGQWVFSIIETPPIAQTEPEPEKKGLLYILQGRKHAALAGRYDPDEFFKEHIFGHEPFYFLAGSESPNAKFQISFKYRLVNEHGNLALAARFFKGFHVAYSQTSLWDWNAPSAPFFDSSYRPELLYSWDRLLGGRRDDWFRIDVAGGLQHESNGRSESDSRSLNIVYFRPRLTIGYDTGPQFSLQPRVWTYVGDVEDNPDIADYRGYVDLRAVFGWKRGFQISALGRIGDDGNNPGAQIDVTYPLMQPPRGSLSIYLHVQYFTGYGESLIGYREKTESVRAGISLYR